MKGSRKSAPPCEMLLWLGSANDAWTPTYGSLTTEVKEALRVSLFGEQRGLCVYCGRKLNIARPGHTFHIEHFWPQNPYHDRAIDYLNLFLSCGQKEVDGQPSQTCGNIKANWFDEEHHVEPEYPDCTQKFSFQLDGTVDCATVGDLSATNMIHRLNLNHPELVQERETLLSLIDAEQIDLDDIWDEASGTSESYGHVAFQHLGKALP